MSRLRRVLRDSSPAADPAADPPLAEPHDGGGPDSHARDGPAAF